MISPKSAARFIARFSVTLCPILGLVFAMALLTEFIRGQVRPVDLLTSWQFWLAVLRDMTPSLGALVAAYLLAAQFVQKLHKTDSLADARGHIVNSLFGQLRFAPWIRVTNGRLDGSDKHVLRRIGGPGRLVVYNDSAAVLERAGHFTRVESQGFPALHPFEKVYTVIDLRPRRETSEVSAMSKEGIPITCEADIQFQISEGDSRPTATSPFPASEYEIFRAATSTWVLEASLPKETRDMDWSSRILMGEAVGYLRSILAQQPLDALIGLSDGGTANPREEIRQELERSLRAAAPNLGARILRVELGDIRVEDSVTQQWIEAWKANWEQQNAHERAKGRAEEIRHLEEAKTRAHLLMIRNLLGAFQPMLSRQQTVTSKLVLARLFMVLSRAPSDPLTRISLPKEAIDTLERLKKTLI